MNENTKMSGSKKCVPYKHYNPDNIAQVYNTGAIKLYHGSIGQGPIFSRIF